MKLKNIFTFFLQIAPPFLSGKGDFACRVKTMHFKCLFFPGKLRYDKGNPNSERI